VSLKSTLLIIIINNNNLPRRLVNACSSCCWLSSFASISCVLLNISPSSVLADVSTMSTIFVFVYTWNTIRIFLLEHISHLFIYICLESKKTHIKAIACSRQYSETTTVLNTAPNTQKMTRKIIISDQVKSGQSRNEIKQSKNWECTIATIRYLAK